MFALHVILNEEGRKALFESIQLHTDRLEDLPDELNKRGIKDSYVKSIEVIETSHWNGWKH